MEFYLNNLQSLRVGDIASPLMLNSLVSGPP